ncbi:MAG: hypothetical protein ACNA7J_01480 [Wenzhouxiangella sp.]
MDAGGLCGAEIQAPIMKNPVIQPPFAAITLLPESRVLLPGDGDCLFFIHRDDKNRITVS